MRDLRERSAVVALFAVLGVLCFHMDFIITRGRSMKPRTEQPRINKKEEIQPDRTTARSSTSPLLLLSKQAVGGTEMSEQNHGSTKRLVPNLLDEELLQWVANNAKEKQVQSMSQSVIKSLNLTIPPLLQRRLGQHVAPGPDSPPGCILFVHLPKAAGTTFGVFLKQIQSKTGWRYPNWYKYFDLFGNLQPPPFYTHASERVIHDGHITPGFLDLVDTSSCFRVTILREPVDRAISNFYYHRLWHNRGNTSWITWDSCLNESATKAACPSAKDYHNLLVRQYSVVSTWNTFDKIAFRRLPVDRKSLQAAKDFLKGMDAVCFMHDLQSCRERVAAGALPVNLRAQLLNTRASGAKKNAHKHENVTDEVRQRLVEANKLDIELYEWAVREFG